MPWRSRWSSARLSSTAASGANASVSSSWNEDASATTIVPGASVPGRPVSAVPTLPATLTGSPASRWRWPISSTVVVLPLEPVTAMNSCSGRSRQPVSYSPSTGIPRSRAAAITGASFGTPGLLMTLPARASSATPSSWACTVAPAAVSRPATSGATAPESTPATSAPRARSVSAAATPERARPTTRYGPGGSGGRGITGFTLRSAALTGRRAANGNGAG